MLYFLVSQTTSMAKQVPISSYKCMLAAGKSLDKESETLLIDRHCDSPGYNAKYGTYTMMGKETKKIVNFEVCHVKQTTKY